MDPESIVETYRCILGFRGLQIDICSNVSAPLTWLEEFMSPALCSEGNFVARKEIRLFIDEHRYAEMLRFVRSGQEQWIDCFTKDGSFEQLAVWRDERDREILHSTQGECFLVLETGGDTIEFVGRADHGTLRRCLMRLVRELAMIQALYRGDLFLHGAAVECRREAIIITGARRAGKTTMLINALRQRDVRYLANDRVFVERTADGLQVRGMPTIVTVRLGSLDHLPGLKLPQWGHPWRHYLTMRECAEGSDLIRPPFQEPPAMNPPQFCRWLGAEMAADAPLRAVVFPQIDPSISNFSLQRISSADGELQLGSNVFWAGDAGPVAKAFSSGWQGAVPTLESLKNSCRDISKQCALFSCRIGPAAFASPNVWDAIVTTAFAG